MGEDDRLTMNDTQNIAEKKIRVTNTRSPPSPIPSEAFRLCATCVAGLDAVRPDRNNPPKWSLRGIVREGSRIRLSLPAGVERLRA